ncbi:alpha/beta fold hydrolase [Fluviicola taffensis]|uniref:Alpha/beta hydrolase fold protein n=1 Tax=Fluviicola taffensis (strain DSM 16823 / NCIMB 13979 / RW262) TaxID=755732 RepID=F2IE45_FLUTR|nr:alpha/beta hydrolase [Fluviicola taffensis]AEA45609.1 alpha/beta hydrolase fold protein [Fluviicola taffensis DSM 16823]
MEKIISLNSTEINLKWINQASLEDSKPILVFLHEALGSIIQWKNFPSELCNSFHHAGIVIERSGHGKSSALNQERDIHYLHYYADETMAVLREVLNPTQKYILIGHSDGGSIALILAARNTKNLQAIVTMAAHTFVEDQTLSGIFPAIEAFEAGKLDGLYKIHGAKTKTLFYAWSNTWLTPSFKTWDIRQEIQSFTIPVLAIQGKDDQYGTEEQVNSIVRNQASRIGKIIPSCGHHPHLEKSKEVMLAISNWMEEKTISKI